MNADGSGVVVMLGSHPVFICVHLRAFAVENPFFCLTVAPVPTCLVVDNRQNFRETASRVIGDD
jgi:hypothetical protein